MRYLAACFCTFYLIGMAFILENYDWVAKELVQSVSKLRIFSILPKLLTQYMSYVYWQQAKEP